MARLKSTLPLGAELVKRNVISNSQLEQVLELQKSSDKQLDVILLEMNFVEGTVLSRIMAESVGFDFIDLDNHTVDPVAAKMIPEYISKQHTLIAISRGLNTITVAMANPVNIIATDDIQLMTGLKVKVVVGTRKAIQSALQSAYKGFSKKDYLSDGY